jgi:hypothetical protein
MVKALIIALEYNKFSDYKLNSSFNDAKRFIKTIKKLYGLKKSDIVFLNDVKHKHNSSCFPSRKNIIEKLEKMRNVNEQIIIYYSGHGKNSSNNEKVLTEKQIRTIDTKQINCFVTNENNELGYINENDMKNMLSEIKSQVLFFIDACHDKSILHLENVYMPNKINKSLKNDLDKLYNCVNGNLEIQRHIRKDIYNLNNIILFSNVRDTDYEYNKSINKKEKGSFTKNLCDTFDYLEENNLDNNLNNICVMLCSLTEKNHIPIISSSEIIDIKNFFLWDNKKNQDNNYKYESNTDICVSAMMCGMLLLLVKTKLDKYSI